MTYRSSPIQITNIPPIKLLLNDGTVNLYDVPSHRYQDRTLMSKS